MTILDWFFLILFSVASLCVIFFLLFLILSFISKKKRSQLGDRRIKDKKKRMKYRKACRKLDQTIKSRRQISLIFFLVASIGFSGAFYSRYYQSRNLGADDSKAIVNAYYLLADTEKELENIQGENPQKAMNTLYDLSARISSYGARKSDYRLVVDGQNLLNRYYLSLKELGLNLHAQNTETLSDEETYQNYVKDMKKIQTTQDEVMTFFNVNKNALQKKK